MVPITCNPGIVVPLNISKDIKYKKITEYTQVIAKDSHTPNSQKRTIGNISPSSSLPKVKCINMENTSEVKVPKNSKVDETDPINIAAENTSLSNALGPLICKFHCLRESVDTVHADYADLRETISKQASTATADLVTKIESNSVQLMNIALENQNLHKENKELWDRLTKVELTQLSDNIIITGIQEGPFEPYHTTKLRVYEMIATTIDSGDKQTDLETAKKVEITGCSRVGKYRHNRTRPISVMFKLCDDKELFLSCKHKLPAGIYANEQYQIHIKRTSDRLLPILRLAKSQSEYREKSRLDGDSLLINGTRYTIDDLDRLPPEIATHKAAEKMNDNHIIFSGELSPYSNFHPCNFVIDDQTYHSSEQYIQYQKALTSGDSYVANKILKTDTAMECKCLSYQINGVDAECWRNEGYDICYEGIKQKFLQNEALLARQKSTTPKILAEAMPDRLWGTGIGLHDKNALEMNNWTSRGWLSRMLFNIRSDY